MSIKRRKQSVRHTRKWGGTYTENNVRGPGAEAFHAIGQNVVSAALAPGQALTAAAKAAYNTPEALVRTGTRMGRSTARKLDSIYKAPGKALSMGYNRVLQPLGRTINNTTRKLVEGKAPIRLRNAELRDAMAELQGASWSEFHYTEMNRQIPLFERVQTTWKYHMDVVRNVLNRGHAVLIPVGKDDAEKPHNMDEAAWNHWKNDPLFPKRSKWLNGERKERVENVRGLTYDSMGYTHMTNQTDSIQTFFQFLDKGFDDPEIVPTEPPVDPTKGPLDDLKSLEPPPVAPKSHDGDQAMNGGAKVANPMYDDRYFEQADKYDIAFQGFPKNKFPLAFLLRENLALESVLERFGKPVNTNQANFQASSSLSKNIMAFFPSLSKTDAKEERDYGTDILASLTNTLRANENKINEPVDGFLPDLLVRSNTDLMPDFYLRRYLPGQVLPPFKGQEKFIVVSDKKSLLAI